MLTKKCLQIQCLSANRSPDTLLVGSFPILVPVSSVMSDEGVVFVLGGAIGEYLVPPEMLRFLPNCLLVLGTTERGKL